MIAFNIFKMSKFFIWFLMFYFFITLSFGSPYTTKYDNIDVEEILKNQRLYKKYLDCLTDKGRCTPDAKELKDALPDALSTGCSKCTLKQKSGSEKVIKFLLEKKPEDFAILEKMYDPKGNYKTKFEEEAKRLGIPL